MIERMREEGPGIDGLKQMISILPKNLKMIEIGSFAGESAEIFLQSGHVSYLTCVDPWESGFDNTDPASNANFSEVEMEFNKRLAPYIGKYSKLKMTSESAVKLFADKSVDFVYIDGLHDYDSVVKDIKMWTSKCKIAICGHDFGNHSPDVVRAVSDIFGIPKRCFADSSWLIPISEMQQNSEKITICTDGN